MIDNFLGIDTFKILKSNIVACHKCKTFAGDLMKDRILCAGDLKTATIFIIGQNPGYPVPASGSHPFSWLPGDPKSKTGSFIDKNFKDLNIDKSKIYISNAVKCATQSSDYKTMLVNCNHFLQLEVELFKGKAIITWGKIAKEAASKLKTDKIIINMNHPSFYTRSNNSEAFKEELSKTIKKYI